MMNMQQATPTPIALVGVVKSFGFQKGFGFIACDQVPGDVYFNRGDLPAVATDGNMEGRTVTFELSLSKDGKPQAKNVQVVPVEGEPCLGEVKSYSEKNGFGFISSPSFPGDVYFNRRDVPAHLPQSNLVGAKVRFSVSLMPDGKVQARNLVFSGVPQPYAALALAALGGPAAVLSQGGKGKGAGAVRAPPLLQLGGLGAIINAAAMAGPPAGAQLVGAVKMYDPEKGYGFIGCSNVPGDVYFKSTDPLDKGQQVTFTLQWSPKGQPQAHNLQPALLGGEVLVGSIKSYNEVKGFGFLSVTDYVQDVYFQTKDLPRELQVPGSSLEGSTIRFVVRLSKDGRPQMQDAELLAYPPQGIKRPAEGASAGHADGAAAGDDGEGPTKRMRTAFGPTPSQAPSAAAALPASWQALAAPAALPAPRPSALPAAGGSDGYGAERVYGRVKSYNATKGFGFIESTVVGTDVYFQRVALPGAFQQQNLAGREVSFDLKFTPDGRPQGVGVQVEG